MRTIETPFIITGISSKVDGSLSVRGTTPELSSLEKTAFFDLQNLNLIATLKPIEEPSEEIKVDKDLEEKPLHVRLRNTLYVLWDKKYKDSYPDFESFYKSKMNRWIEDLKETIPQ